MLKLIKYIFLLNFSLALDLFKLPSKMCQYGCSEVQDWEREAVW